ncbi:MAG: hypothetical protein Q9201_004390 [Fulgogasparrea decipioides]
MKLTSTFAAVSVLAPIALAAPAPTAFNETAFDELVTRDNPDYTGGDVKADIKIMTYQDWHCRGQVTLHDNVVYDHNYADGKMKSYSISRDLKPNEHLDFSGKAGGGTKRGLGDEVDTETEVAETSFPEGSPLEARKFQPLCERYFDSAPMNLKAGCYQNNVPAGCFRLWRSVNVMKLGQKGRIGISDSGH